MFLKILFLQNINGISGSELYLMQLLPELKLRGHDVEMLLVFKNDATQANKDFVEQLHKFNIVTYEWYGYHPLSVRLLYKLYKLIKHKQYAVVQSNLIHADLWTAIVELFSGNRFKLVSVKHTYYPAYQAKYGYDFKYLKYDTYYWIERFTSRRANMNVTISKGLYLVFTEGRILHPKKVINIYYGLTLTDKYNEKVELINEPYILIIGRLVAFKGHHYLIEAWEKVHKIFPELKLLIAGDGELKQELEKKVSEKGLSENIIFLGHVKNPHPLIKKSMFTVIPSIWEGFGLILLESWLHRKPVIAFDVPAMNEIIDHEKNGLLVIAKNSNDLADKIIYLYQQQELIEAYGENGYQKLITYFTLKRMADETEKMYQQLVQ